MLELNKIYNMNCMDGLRSLEDKSIDCIVTSPPYWKLRDYGHQSQIGMENDFHDYLDNLRAVFLECQRVLKPTGTMYIVIADTYNGDKKAHTDAKMQYQPNKEINKTMQSLPRKTLLNIPARLSILLQDDGWILRNRIVWHKPNVMPSSVDDRFTIDFEDVFFFTKEPRYYFKQIKEPMQGDPSSIKAYYNGDKCRGSLGTLGQPQSGRRKQDEVGRNDYTGFNDRYEPPKDGMRNKRCVWSVVPKGIKDGHYATFPEELVEPMIESGCPENGVVLDPFSGSGTTAMVAKKMNRQYIGFDLVEEYCEIAEKRISKAVYQARLELEDRG